MTFIYIYLYICMCVDKENYINIYICVCVHVSVCVCVCVRTERIQAQIKNILGVIDLIPSIMNFFSCLLPILKFFSFKTSFPSLVNTND